MVSPHLSLSSHASLALALALALGAGLLLVDMAAAVLPNCGDFDN